MLVCTSTTGESPVTVSRFLDTADTHLGVDRRHPAAAQLERLARDGGEPGQRERDGVGARAQVDDLILAVGVGHDRPRPLDERRAPGQPPLADYLGLALNEAGRLRADTTPESIWGTPEYPVPAALGAASVARRRRRPHPQGPRSDLPRDHRLPPAVHALARPADLRRRPSASAGLGAAQLERILHRRVDRSDPEGHDDALEGRLLEARWAADLGHADDDGVHHAGTTTSSPSSRSWTIRSTSTSPTCCRSPTPTIRTPARRRRTAAGRRLPRTAGAIGTGCRTSCPAEQRDRGVPQDADLDPARAGARRRQDDLSRVPRGHGQGATTLNSLTVPVSKSANDVAKRIADQSPRDGQVHVMPVQGNIYMLVADGTNITASIGRDGIAVVNTGSAQMTDKVLAAITELARTAVSAPATNTCFGANCPGMPSWSSPYFNAVVASPPPARPIRYVINTSAAPSTWAATRSWRGVRHLPPRRRRRRIRRRRARSRRRRPRSSRTRACSPR